MGELKNVVREEWVRIESAGLTLAGISAEPAGTQAVRECVVFVHGWGGYRIGPHRMIVKIARRLAENGVASVRFDLRGRGDSEGEPRTTTLDGMIQDSCAAADLAKARWPGARLSIWGICSGGNVAIGAATLRPDVRKLILLSTLPFMDRKGSGERVARTRMQVRQYARKALRLETWKKLLRGALDWVSIRKVLFGDDGTGQTDQDREAKQSRRDVMSAFEDYRGEAYFIYGGADEEAVEARGHFEEFTRRHGIPSEMVVIEGSNHDYYSMEWEDRIGQLTLEWIVNR